MLTPEDLDDAADTIEKLRSSLVIDKQGIPQTQGLPPIVSEELKTAQHFLGLAVSSMRKAHYHAMRK